MSLVSPKAVQTAVKSQLFLFAEFTPILSTVVSKLGFVRTPGAMATPEQHKSDHEESRREFLCFRPPRGALNGVSRAAWNVSVGTIAPPFLFLAAALGGLAHDGPPGLVLGLARGVGYGALWAGMGYTAAGLQILQGVLNTLASPFMQSLLKRRWDPLRGRWVRYSTQPDGYLALFEDTEEIWLAAIRRHAERFGSVDKAAGLSAHSDGRSFYDVLGIQQDASEKDIKDAFKRMAKHLHPDRNPNPEARAQFEEVTVAYKTLSDANARKRYDAGGTKALNQKDEQTKREALRGVFGGQKLSNITGDVRTSRFSRRMLEDAYMLHEENLVVVARQRELCVANLLELLEGHPGRGSLQAARDDVAGGEAKTSADGDDKPKRRNPLGDSGGGGGGLKKKTPLATTDGGAYTAWQEKARKIVKDDFAQIGICREVLYVIGHEYDLCHQYALGSPVTRLRIVASTAVKHARMRLTQLQLGFSMMTSSSKWRSDQEFVMDTVWKLSVPELEANSRFIVLSVLLDETATPEERQRRADAIADLSGLFIGVGQKYEGASAAAIQKLKEAVMKERQRKSNETYN